MALLPPNARQPDPQQAVYRLLLLHPRADNPAWLAQLRQAIWYVLQNATQQQNPGHKVELVTGEEDYSRRWHACGGWDGWIAAVGNDAGYYSGYVVPGPEVHVGRATYGIIEIALRRGAAVFWVDPNTGTVLPVTGVQPTGVDDWTRFGTVTVAGPFPSEGTW